MDDDEADIQAAVDASLEDMCNPGVATSPGSSSTLTRHMSDADPVMAEGLRNQRVQSQWRSESSGMVHFGPLHPDTAVGGTVVLLPSGPVRGVQPGVDMVQLLVNQRLTDEAEAGGIINAHTPCSRFVALCTLGDGQCLCHAASLGVWGVHDRDRVLRSALQESMASELGQGQLRRRFFHQLCKTGLPSDMHLSEWEREREAVAGSGDLSDIHAFLLANVLRRPILVYGDAQADAAGLTGVYLPLLAAAVGDACWREPLPLLFSRSHFSLLAVLDGSGPVTHPLLPLESRPGALLKIRFLSAEEEQGSFEPHLELLVRHMNCCQLPSGGLGVRFERSHLPALLANLLDSAL